MKLERISAAAHTELPNDRPLNRNHRVSKISAPIPDRNSTAQMVTMRSVAGTVCGELVCAFACTVVVIDLLRIGRAASNSRPISLCCMQAKEIVYHRSRDTCAGSAGQGGFSGCQPNTANIR